MVQREPWNPWWIQQGGSGTWAVAHLGETKASADRHRHRKASDLPDPLMWAVTYDLR